MSVTTLLLALRRFVNHLLPFTDPSTPLLQDLVHTATLIALFYYAPGFIERAQGHNGRAVGQAHDEGRPNTRAEREAAFQNGDAMAEALGDRGTADEEIVEDDGDEAWDHDPDALFDRDDTHAQAQADHEDAALNPQEDDPFFDNGEGPAQGQQQRQQARAARTNIGTKKAKSIARRDQRRAYHEFHRQEAEVRRQRDAEDAEEREEALLEEKRRRAVIEMEVEEKQRKEREERRVKEEAERARELARREEVVRRVREGVEARGYVDLRTLEGEEEYVRGLVRSSGILGERRTESGTVEVRILTTGGWVVRIDQKTMDEAYKRALRSNKGAVSLEELGTILEETVKGREGR